MKKVAKLLLAIYILSLWFGLTNFGNAQNDFEIIPESLNPTNVPNEVECVWWQDKVSGIECTEWSIRDRYSQIADSEERTLWDEMASWIMNRDTLLDYAVYLVKFLSQIGLVVWALMIIYAGYLYATDIFGSKAGEGKTAITRAVQWVIVISFSYAIMKFLTSAFLS